VAGGRSRGEFGEKAGAVLAALPVAVGKAVVAGLVGYAVAPNIVGFVIAWIMGLPHNEHVKLIEDLRIYCGFGLMVIVFIATLIEKAGRK
jgi:predicted membrane channel-forming protein YqfA (hemolysin III family)